MKKFYNNNKGFSLVELVVVVLIMAIVAVALAPQVMKWVENSRIASDLETRNSIENNCILAIADEEVFDLVKDGGYEIVITKPLSGPVTFDYYENPGTAGASPVPFTGGNRPDPDTNAFWASFLNVGGFEDFEEFEDAVAIKSSPAGGSPIVLHVYVYQGGHTFSELDGAVSGDLNVGSNASAGET